MFEVSFIVDAKRLGDVLAVLDGQVYALKQRLIKVENEEKKPDKRKLMSGRPKRDELRHYIGKLKEMGITQFSTREASKALGTHLNYTSTILTDVMNEDHDIRRVSQGIYSIL